MPSHLSLPPAGFDELPVDDQIEYVELLWERVAAKAEQVPVPDWHKAVLEERLAERPSVTRDWSEVRDEIRAKFTRGSSR